MKTLKRFPNALLPLAVIAVLGCGGSDSARSKAAAGSSEYTPHPKLVGLSDYISSSLPDWEVPGLAVAVVVDDQVVFAEGFGIKQIGTRRA